VRPCKTLVTLCERSLELISIHSLDARKTCVKLKEASLILIFPYSFFFLLVLPSSLTKRGGDCTHLIINTNDLNQQPTSPIAQITEVANSGKNSIAFLGRMKRGCIISIYAKRQHKTTRPALSIDLRSPHMLLPQIPSGNFDVTVSTSATLFSSPSAIQCSNRKTASDKNATQKTLTWLLLDEKEVAINQNVPMLMFLRIRMHPHAMLWKEV